MQPSTTTCLNETTFAAAAAEEMIRKTSDAKPKSILRENKEIGKNNRSQTENLSATAEEEVTMVPMQNQNPADFANRIGRKVEVKTKHPFATADKIMTKTFRHKTKNQPM